MYAERAQGIENEEKGGKKTTKNTKKIVLFYENKKDNYSCSKSIRTHSKFNKASLDLTTTQMNFFFFHPLLILKYKMLCHKNNN